MKSRREQVTHLKEQASKRLEQAKNRALTTVIAKTYFPQSRYLWKADIKGMQKKPQVMLVTTICFFARTLHLKIHGSI